MISPDNPLRFVIAGCLNRDTILPISGLPQIDVFGGNCAYSAVGLNLWGKKAGLLARVDHSYPLAWLDRFRNLGFDLSGVKVLPGSFDTRRFMAHESQGITHIQNPIQHFAERGLSFPKSLLGYRPTNPTQTNSQPSTERSLQISDIPHHYLEAGAVHICPIDLNSHIILPSIFRQHQASTITLASYPGYMDPAYWETLPGLLSDLTAFITPEEEIRNLFMGYQTELWEMAAALSELGPEFIIIITDTGAYYLLDRQNNSKWVIPQYRANSIDPTGTRDAFAGGFLAGYREHYDAVEAAVMGSIAASIVTEGSGVYYGVGALPELVMARRLVLRELVRQA